MMMLGIEQKVNAKHVENNWYITTAQKAKEEHGKHTILKHKKTVVLIPYPIVKFCAQSFFF